MIQLKIKGTVKKNYEYLPDFLETKAYQTIPLKLNFNLVSQSL